MFSLHIIYLLFIIYNSLSFSFISHDHEVTKLFSYYSVSYLYPRAALKLPGKFLKFLVINIPTSLKNKYSQEYIIVSITCKSKHREYHHSTVGFYLHDWIILFLARAHTHTLIHTHKMYVSYPLGHVSYSFTHFTLYSVFSIPPTKGRHSFQSCSHLIS